MSTHSTKKPCPFPGCGKKRYMKGLCQGHFNHQKKGKPLAVLRRWRARLEDCFQEVPCASKEVKGNCWQWTMSRTGGGYGKKWVGDRFVLAHRAMWEKLRGPIPDGMLIDHVCRNRACCNPDHLRVVTPKQNATENVVRIRK